MGNVYTLRVDMSDHAAQRIIDSETGYKRDLREAELQIVAADNDPVALAKAFNRHAEAVRNMMIAEIIPSFERVLAPLLDDKLTPVVLGLGGLQAGVARLNDNFQSISTVVEQLVTDVAQNIQARLVLNAELQDVKAHVHTLSALLEALTHEFSIYRAGSRRDEIDLLKTQISELSGNFSSDERARLISVLLTMIRDYEASHTHS